MKKVYKIKEGSLSATIAINENKLTSVKLVSGDLCEHYSVVNNGIGQTGTFAYTSRGTERGLNELCNRVNAFIVFIKDPASIEARFKNATYNFSTTECTEIDTVA